MDVENFIDLNGRLPGIPSAKEVTEKGLRVAEMQTLMMAKIEELTLHMIQMNKKVEKLSEENTALKAKLAEKND